MASVKLIRAETGKQTVFGTPVTPTFQLPLTGEYEDVQTEHIAEWDQGTFSPTEIVAQTSKMARFSLRGASFFELWPFLLAAGFNEPLTASVTAPYSYTDLVTPTAVGAPRPYTFRFGSRTNIGGTGPAVQVQDAYLESLVINGNINNRQIGMESRWFGLQVDDNSGAGYAMASAALPTPLGMMRILLGSLAIVDAGTTGGVFTGMSSFTGSLLDWKLTINTGLVPKWTADANALTYAGVRMQPPSITFEPTLRTDADAYALTRAKYDARTYQELQITLSGDDSRQAILRITGRWARVPSSIARKDNEQVFKPVFMGETPHAQTIRPHYFGWTVDTRWEHSSGNYLALENGAGAVLQENGLLIRIEGT